ncbi:hypothetical protein ACUZ9P_01985 [Desulfovibrio sp. QI0430]
MVSNDTLWNLENADQAAKDIQFWNSEYMKRKFMKEGNYNELKDLYAEFTCIWREYLKKFKKEYNDKYESNFIKHIQLSYLAIEINQIHQDDEFDFSKEFDSFFRKSDVSNILQVFNNISMEYNYFVDDILNMHNMSDILLNISKLPDPPIFHMNKNCHIKFSEEVLTLLRLHPQNLTEISAPSASRWKNALRKYSEYKFGDVICVGKYCRNVDFAIMGQSLHEDFDIEEVCNEIKDHIAWNIYELKKKYNIKLKLQETKIIVDLYKKMAFGEYGNSHRAARAIGLWLWDQRNRNEDIHSDRAAVQALRDKKLDVEHQASDSRTLLRLLENAKICIEKGQAVAINKQSGRPKKAHAV